MRLSIRSLSIAATSIAATALVGVLAFADVSPSDGTIGTEFTVDFGEDADIGNKPKITLSYEDDVLDAKKAKTPKAKAKLVSSDATSATFVIQAAKGGGAFRIGVKKSDVDGGVLFLAAPDIDGYDTTSVGAGGELKIFGEFFGELANKRNAPKVYVGGKKARVTAFSNDELTISLHKKTPSGLQDVRIVNKVGEVTDTGAVTVTAPPRPIKGSDNMTGTIDGSKFKAIDKKDQIANAVFNVGTNQLTITGVAMTGGRTSPRIRTFTISLIGVGAPLDQITTPLALTGDQGGIAVLFDVQTRLTGPNPGVTTKEYDSSGKLPVSVTIDSVAGNRISGSFSCQMREGGGNALIDASGTFVLTVEQ